MMRCGPQARHQRGQNRPPPGADCRSSVRDFAHPTRLRNPPSQMRRVGIAPPRSIIRASYASAMPTRCVAWAKSLSVRCKLPFRSRRFCPPYADFAACCASLILRHTCSLVSGMSSSVTPRGGERVEHRADQRRGRADRTRFPAAFGAERIVSAGLAPVDSVTNSLLVGWAKSRTIRRRRSDAAGDFAHPTA
jgi:hypothetical protein